MFSSMLLSSLFFWIVRLLRSGKLFRMDSIFGSWRSAPCRWRTFVAHLPSSLWTNGIAHSSFASRQRERTGCRTQGDPISRCSWPCERSGWVGSNSFVVCCQCRFCGICQKSSSCRCFGYVWGISTASGGEISVSTQWVRDRCSDSQPRHAPPAPPEWRLWSSWRSQRSWDPFRHQLARLYLARRKKHSHPFSPTLDFSHPFPLSPGKFWKNCTSKLSSILCKQMIIWFPHTWYFCIAIDWFSFILFHSNACKSKATSRLPLYLWFACCGWAPTVVDITFSVCPTYGILTKTCLSSFSISCTFLFSTPNFHF